MPDYQKGKIYKIISDHTEKCYVGSTCQTLPNRMKSHRSDIKGTTASQIMCFDDARAELIEDFSCHTRKELLTRETHWMRELNCVNQIKPIITDEERKANAKQYRIDNKEYIAEEKKKWHAANLKPRNRAPEKIIINCECGAEVQKGIYNRHMRSKKHLFWETISDFIYN